MIRTTHVALAFLLACGVTVAGAQTASPGSKLQTATGTVKTVSESTVTVEQGGVEVMFAVSKTTRFIGRGTRGTDLVLRWPRKPSEFLKPGDRVTVTFRQSDNAAMNAVEVRVVRR